MGPAMVLPFRSAALWMLPSLENSLKAFGRLGVQADDLDVVAVGGAEQDGRTAHAVQELDVPAGQGCRLVRTGSDGGVGGGNVLSLNFFSKLWLAFLQ